MPTCYISTDIIVGFPGETEEDFMQTYNLIKNVRYDGVFAFMFSPRTGTVAEKMENQIESGVKNERVNRLLKLSKAITKEKTKECLNHVYDVLVEKIENNNAYCVNDSGRNIIIENANDLEVNHFYKVVIERVQNNGLYAKLL